MLGIGLGMNGHIFARSSIISLATKPVMTLCVPCAAATPSARLAVESKASFAPRTEASSQTNHSEPLGAPRAEVTGRE